MLLLSRKTPAQRHRVTRGGQLRSLCSALGVPSVVLDFEMGCRCQVADSSLHAGGVMRFRHLHVVTNVESVRPL